MSSDSSSHDCVRSFAYERVRGLKLRHVVEATLGAAAVTLLQGRQATHSAAQKKKARPMKNQGNDATENGRHRGNKQKKNEIQ